ncbi:hypothetical protein [Cetobacterium sp.]
MDMNLFGEVLKKFKEKFNWSCIIILILTITAIIFSVIYGQSADAIVFILTIIIAFILFLKKTSKFKHNLFNIEKECEFLDGNSKEKYYEKLVDLRNNYTYTQIGFIVTICISGTIYKLNIIKIFDVLGVGFTALISLIMMKLFTDANKHFLNQIKVYEKKIGFDEKFDFMPFNNIINYFGLIIFFMWFILIVGGALREIRIEQNSKTKKYDNMLIEKLNHLNSEELKYVEATINFILSKKQ